MKKNRIILAIAVVWVVAFVFSCADKPKEAEKAPKAGDKKGDGKKGAGKEEASKEAPAPDKKKAPVEEEGEAPAVDEEAGAPAVAEEAEADSEGMSPECEATVKCCNDLADAIAKVPGMAAPIAEATRKNCKQYEGLRGPSASKACAANTMEIVESAVAYKAMSGFVVPDSCK